MYYQVPLEISKQEDGLWRVSAPCLRGCWVDTPTLEDGITEVQEVIRMTIDVYREYGWELPAEVTKHKHLPLHASIPVNDAESSKTKAPKPRTKAITAQ
jgi:predicted RNase H-like HicB family nuclease